MSVIHDYEVLAEAGLLGMSPDEVWVAAAFHDLPEDEEIERLRDEGRLP